MACSADLARPSLVDRLLGVDAFSMFANVSSWDIILYNACMFLSDMQLTKIDLNL